MANKVSNRVAVLFLDFPEPIEMLIYAQYRLSLSASFIRTIRFEADWLKFPENSPTLIKPHPTTCRINDFGLRTPLSVRHVKMLISTSDTHFKL
jgi:hypothetical protein